MSIVQPPFLPDEGREGVSIDHLIDGSEPGSWAEVLLLFPHSLRVLDDPSCKLPDADGPQCSSGIVSRRKGHEPFLDAPPARVLNTPHAQLDRPEAR